MYKTCMLLASGTAMVGGSIVTQKNKLCLQILSGTTKHVDVFRYETLPNSSEKWSVLKLSASLNSFFNKS